MRKIPILPGGRLDVALTDETTREILRMVEERAPYLFTDATPHKHGRVTLRALCRYVIQTAVCEYAARGAGQAAGDEHDAQLTARISAAA